jgi:hypothetical protein
MKKLYALDRDNSFIYFFEKINSTAFFMNRMGGSDIQKYLQYTNDKNPNIDEYIHYLSEWNGYYDTSTDANIRMKNLDRFFSELYNIYKRNNLISSIFRPTMPKEILNNKDFANSTLIDYINLQGISFYKHLFNFYKGKKILIVSPFVEQIKEQIDILKKCNPPPAEGTFADYIKNSNFEFLKTYITYFNTDTQKNINIPHKDFFETVSYYKTHINNIDFDVALLSCGSYAHFIGDYIRNINKKAIYIGSILQMAFGIFGNTWLGKGPKMWDGHDLNNCVLNTYPLPPNYGRNIIESLNSYCYDERKFENKLKTFNYENYKKQGYNEMGAKVKHLCNKCEKCASGNLPYLQCLH